MEPKPGGVGLGARTVRVDEIIKERALNLVGEFCCNREAETGLQFIKIFYVRARCGSTCHNSSTGEAEGETLSALDA